MKKKVMIPAVIAAVVVLGGVGFKAYTETGFGTAIVEGYESVQNGIVNGYMNFQNGIVETAENFIASVSNAD